MIFSPMIETMGYLKPFAIFLKRNLLNETLEPFKPFTFNVYFTNFILQLIPSSFTFILHFLFTITAPHLPSIHTSSILPYFLLLYKSG